MIVVNAPPTGIRDTPEGLRGGPGARSGHVGPPTGSGP
ncbi:hypothetical protein SAMN05216207_1002115 [Pseudonocardia ammonioxydans]|uniref:Uncharacterized protein n=1 Tax=Pseudonocardia ammonioxydans TaxID=260086 RepID=A0A1I4T5F0_PSUAM|nr:hypothetical protein SAMN05216207_1002115 [Pseudonocardia ammonioxydans]